MQFQNKKNNTDSCAEPRKNFKCFKTDQGFEPISTG